MKALTDDDKLFCKTFVSTFDFNHSCEVSSSNRAEMAKRLADESDFVNIHIRNHVDERRISNQFFTKDLIKNELIKTLMTGDDKSKLQSAKQLINLDEDKPDKTKEFTDLIDAIKGA